MKYKLHIVVYLIYGKIHVRSSEHDHSHNGDNARVGGDHVNDTRDDSVRIRRGIPRSTCYSPSRGHTRPPSCGGGGQVYDRNRNDDGGDEEGEEEYGSGGPDELLGGRSDDPGENSRADPRTLDLVVQ